METNRTPSNQAPVDVQIVGAGVAGLVAANLAIDAGLTVRLIERRSAPGGRAATTDHHGYALNVGPHALYLQGAFRQILDQLDLVPAGTAPEVVGGTGSIGDRVGLLPVGPASLVRTGLLSARAKVEVGRFLARLPRLDPHRFADTTVEEWIGRSVRSADARALLGGIINLSTYNAAADRASADAAAAQLQIALDPGVHYVHGGWGTIVEGLSARAAARGVERVEASIVGVSPRQATDGPAVTVAETTYGARLQARTCLIAAGGPTVVDRLLDLGTKTAEAAGPSVEASALDLGLRRRPAVGAHLGLDRRLYATVQSVAPGQTPPGRHLVGLARYRLPGESTRCSP
ncbi:MAG: NAD(P)-binding protein, partial [Actinomycetota bacterium]